MVVYDIVVNGVVKETLTPKNQRIREMYWFLIDQVELFRQKHGNDIKVYRRVIF